MTYSEFIKTSVFCKFCTGEVVLQIFVFLNFGFVFLKSGRFINVVVFIKSLPFVKRLVGIGSLRVGKEIPVSRK